MDKDYEQLGERFVSIDQPNIHQRPWSERFESRYNEHDQRFDNIDWMLALIIVTTVIPVLQRWYTA
jgi:hypothetical protein